MFKNQFKTSLVLLLLPIVLANHSADLSKHTKITPNVEVEITVKKPTYQITDLVNALIQVESRGRDHITGDHHLGQNFAAGALQIRPIMLKEINRILKLQKKSKRFKLSDRFDRQKSIEMFHIWREYHHQDSSFEKIVRNWNGGPRGYLKESTQHHWHKTQKVLSDI